MRARDPAPRLRPTREPRPRRAPRPATRRRARCGSRSRRAACTCSTPRSAAASRDRCRCRSCRPSRAVRSRAWWTPSGRTPTRPGWGGGSWRTSARCPAGTPSRRSPASDKLFPVPDHVSFPDAVAAVGTGRTALGVVELEPPTRRRRGAGAVGRRWAGLAAGAVGAGRRCDGGRGGARRHARTRSRTSAPHLVVDYGRARLGGPGPASLGGVTLVYDGVGGEVGRAVARAAPAGRPAGDVRLLGRHADRARPPTDLVGRGISAGWSLGPRMMALPGRHPGAGRPGAARRWRPASGGHSSRRTRWRTRPARTPTSRAAGRSGKVVLVPATAMNSVEVVGPHRQTRAEEVEMSEQVARAAAAARPDAVPPLGLPPARGRAHALDVRLRRLAGRPGLGGHPDRRRPGAALGRLDRQRGRRAAAGAARRRRGRPDPAEADPARRGRRRAGRHDAGRRAVAHRPRPRSGTSPRSRS